MKLPTIKRPSLLMLTAGAAALSTLAHGVSASPSEGEQAAAAKGPQSRLGSAIQREMSQHNASANERARALDLREQVLKASEKRLEANLQAQSQPQAGGNPSQSTPGKEKADAANELDQLARIYQSMKAKQAAAVFEQLDIDVQIAVARKMRERSTAQILAAMTPAGAARLSMALAGKKPRPATVAAR